MTISTYVISQCLMICLFIKRIDITFRGSMLEMDSKYIKIMHFTNIMQIVASLNIPIGYFVYPSFLNLILYLFILISHCTLSIILITSFIKRVQMMMVTSIKMRISESSIQTTQSTQSLVQS